MPPDAVQKIRGQISNLSPDMVDTCQEERLLPVPFFAGIGNISVHGQERGPCKRRQTTLICADWVPHDLASSWSCLSLLAGIRQLTCLIPRGTRGFSSPGPRPWQYTKIYVKDFLFYLYCFSIIRRNCEVQRPKPSRNVAIPSLKIHRHFFYAGWETCLAIAHMKPASSRAMAATTIFIFLPRPMRR